MRTALYPGTFDPPTRGHLDVIRRAARLFDELVIAVAAHPTKQPVFSLTERLELVRELVREMPHVHVTPLEGMTVACAKTVGAEVIVRGIRTLSDFDYEFQMALANRMLDESVETLFILAAPEHSSISSSLIKEAASLGADVSAFVPESVARRLHEKLRPQKQRRAEGETLASRLTPDAE